MHIWKCYIFAGKQGLKGRSRNKFKRAIEECHVRVQVQGEITPKGGKDQGVTTEHPRGLKRKGRTSCEKTTYQRGDDIAKMMRGPTWKKG
jgi:hypothetical protein